MTTQTKHQSVLNSVSHATIKASRYGPGDPSTNGFRRLRLRVPEVRAMVKAGYDFEHRLNRAEILKTWHYVFTHTDIYEVAYQAIYYYQYKSLNKTEFNTVRQWINRCDSWEHSDDLSKIYALVFEENPDWVIPWYRKWNRDRNPWKRRQSVVGLLEYAQKRKAVQPYEVLISFIEPLLEDDDYYVQKGVGWTLREIYNVYPRETLAFMNREIARIHPNAYGAATEKLSRSVKNKLNTKRKRLRS